MKSASNFRVVFFLLVACFLAVGMDGRIDNTNGGWRGRGIYATYGPDMTWHMEGGVGTKTKLVKFQLRPTPLAD